MGRNILIKFLNINVMKKWFFIFYVVLASCSNQYDAIVNSAPSPDLHFSKDTLRIRERDYLNVGYSNNGKLTIYCSEAAHELNLSLDDTSTRVHVLYRGTEISSGESLPVMDSIQVFVNADVAGIYALDFYLRDRLGKTVKKRLVVKAAANGAAVASFFYEALPPFQLQSWPYLFNASLSSKPDGIIVSYHYSVNGQMITTYDPVMNWVFHAKGVHNIGLYVTDDLGKNSDTVHQQIKIP